MRISTKLTLASSLLGLVLFGGVGTFQIAKEKHDLEAAALRDSSTLCRAVAESIRQDMDESDPLDSEELTRSLERFDARLDVVWWRGTQAAPLGRQELHSPPDLIQDLAMRAQTSGDIVTTIAEGPDGVRRAVVAALVSPGGPDAVVVVRPLEDVDADIAAEAKLVAIAVASFSMLGGLLGFVLGQIYVEQPLSRLDRGLARIAAGELETAIGPGRDDEVGRVMRRFDEMARELHGAQKRLQREQDAHRAVLARLRDADRLVTVGQLSAGLAHEIGSPLQVLRTRARKLEQHANNPAEVAKAATIIATQLGRITRAVQQLLQFARPKALQLCEVDPAAAVGAVVELLEFEAKRRHVDIIVRTDDLRVVRTDPDALQQIVLNLARNALGALDASGEPSRDSPSDSPPSFRATIVIALRRIEENPPKLSLRVVDNGPGMHDDVMQRMFEPFFTTRGSDGGMGLGLAVVKSLVDALDGQVTVDSDAGGTRFEVVLPC